MGIKGGEQNWSIHPVKGGEPYRLALPTAACLLFRLDWVGALDLSGPKIGDICPEAEFRDITRRRFKLY
jgi:hypothetical protein